MGFFSKLFKKNKKEQTIESSSIAIESNTIIKEISPIAKESSHVTIEFDRKPVVPPSQGNYAKTVFLWANSKASPIRNNASYPSYLLYECGISNPSQYHRNLLSEGYFEEASFEQQLASLKVTQLKEILSTLKEPTSGKKDALILRILANGNTSIIEQHYPDKLYMLSTLGQSFLDEHYDYVQVHKHKNWGIDWKEYDANKVPGRSYYSNMWGIFNKQLSKAPQNYGRFQYYCMYQLLNEENKRDIAIEMLIRVLYLDLSGIFLLNYADSYRMGISSKEEMQDMFGTIISFGPTIISQIKSLADVYSDDIVARVYEHRLPVMICDQDLFLSIVHSIIDGTINEKATEDKLRQLYYKYLHDNLFK